MSVSLASDATEPVQQETDDLTDAFEASGCIRLTGSPGSVDIAVGNDASEPYQWEPSNLQEVTDFFNALSNTAGTEAATITIRDFTPAAPAFADDTGDTITGTVGEAITAVTVPEATGGPAPTYAAVGNLPAGLAFNDTTRVMSGTPTAAGSGTIRIRATNSEGTADWTVAYTFTVALSETAFADDTGDAITGTANTPIAQVTVPEATGNPSPTYAVVGSLPGGLAFNTTTRVLSGTPTAAGSGTIRVRATNSEGTADWTVAYTFTVSLSAPAFAHDTGTPVTCSRGTAIVPVTVPAATGVPAPSNTVVGSLPAGFAFDAATRRITGTPT